MEAFKGQECYGTGYATMMREWLDDDLVSVLDDFHEKFVEATGYDGRGSKSASQKALAKALRDEVLPNIELMKISDPVKRRREIDFKLKMF
jgi:hypothetical protein